jgi:hypothetical protein
MKNGWQPARGKGVAPAPTERDGCGGIADLPELFDRQDKDRLRELYAEAWNDCKPRNAGLPNARAIQQLVRV